MALLVDALWVSKIQKSHVAACKLFFEANLMAGDLINCIVLGILYVSLQRFKGPYSQVLTSPFSSGHPSIVVRFIILFCMIRIICLSALSFRAEQIKGQVGDPALYKARTYVSVSWTESSLN